MSDTHLCSGCDTTFSLRGYQSHLSQTRNPLCRAVFDRLKESYETYQQLELKQAAASPDDAIEDIDMEPEGELAFENPSLEGVLDGEVLDDNEDNDSELDDDGSVAAEWETGWEQPRDGAPQDDAGGDEPADIRSDMETTESRPDDEKSDNDPPLPPQPNFDRYIIGDGYGVKPAVRMLYTDKYPSSHAGKPLSVGESRDSIYGMSLGGGDNVWAPFHLKKDWEIARWAKLRGVGSTAFSELLAIDGVSFHNLNLLSNFHIKISI